MQQLLIKAKTSFFIIFNIIIFYSTNRRSSLEITEFLVTRYHDSSDVI
jgi:hypothetical protein